MLKTTWRIAGILLFIACQNHPTAPAAVAAGPLQGVIALASGAKHTCALLVTGGVMCWGDNSAGQLGDGTTIHHGYPFEVLGLSTGIVSLAAGEQHTCALTTSGGVKCWGSNSAGQIGDGTTNPRTSPTDVIGLASGVSAIAAGREHTCALTASGGVKCWGRNMFGQLGDGTTLQRSLPGDVSGLDSGVTALATGQGHTCAALAGGGARCWGWNSQGELGDGTYGAHLTPVAVSGLNEVITALAAGREHTCALTANGGAWCWGANINGQIGDGTVYSRNIPTEVSGLAGGVAAITTGDAHSCALTEGGAVKCWGSNYFGALGDSTTEDRRLPVDVTHLDYGFRAISAGWNHTCAATVSGEARCWGSNIYSQLGDGRVMQRLTPVRVEGLAPGFSQISAGAEHTCALTATGGVACWGRNDTGQLGDGTTSWSGIPVGVSGLASGMTRVDSGHQHTCAVTSGGGVKCWGWNAWSQLGDGTNMDRRTPVDVTGLRRPATAVAAGGGHTCALNVDGGVQCWGANGAGQLGDGTNTTRSTPVDVAGLSAGITAVSAGNGYTCALNTNGGVICWGFNEYGQLGDGTTEDRNLPVSVAGLSSNVIALAAGGEHTCAVTVDGAVLCWGQNNLGQLGDGTNESRRTAVPVSGLSSGVIDITAGGSHTCALNVGGGLKCWGANWNGMLGDGTTAWRNTPLTVFGMNSGVTGLTAGRVFTCAALFSQQVKCWGWDFYGLLGQGTVEQRQIATPVLAPGPHLKLNYSIGAPGSWFALSGENSPSRGQAQIRINGVLLPTAAQMNADGSFLISLDTTNAEPGFYRVSAGDYPENSAVFILQEQAPLRPVEGSNPVLEIPAGIAVELGRTFLPFLGR